MITSFYNVKENNKKYKINSFIENADFFCDCACNKGKLLPLKSKKVIIDNLNKPIEKLYNVDGKIYAYQNKNIFCISNGTEEKITKAKFNFLPKLLKAPVSFGNTLMIIDGERALLFGDENGSIFLPKGKKYFVFNGTIFTFNGKSLYFDAKNEQINMEEDGFARIDIDESLGKIVDVVSVKNTLYVIAEYGMQALSLLQEKKDFYLKDVVAFPVSVRENTVKKIGDEIFFISGKKLCKISGGKIVYLNAFFEEKDFSYSQEVFCFNGEYCLPFSFNGKEYVYSYSAISGEEKIYQSKDMIFCDGGYCFDTEKKQFCLMSDNIKGKFVYESLNSDLGSVQSKTITEIQLAGNGNFEITLDSDVEKRTFFVKANKPLKRTNFDGNVFSYKIESLTDGATIEELTFLFRE